VVSCLEGPGFPVSLKILNNFFPWKTLFAVFLFAQSDWRADCCGRFSVNAVRNSRWHCFVLHFIYFICHLPDFLPEESCVKDHSWRCILNGSAFSPIACCNISEQAQGRLYRYAIEISLFSLLRKKSWVAPTYFFSKFHKTDYTRPEKVEILKLLIANSLM